LHILKSKRLIELTERFVENFVEAHYESKNSNDNDDAGQDCSGGGCPRANYVEYLQVPAADADGETPYFAPNSTDYFWPEYLPKTDRRRKMFLSSPFPDFAAHFGWLFHVLAEAKSPLIDEIRQREYDLGVFGVFMGPGSFDR
jgi:hypothetical protein